MLLLGDELKQTVVLGSFEGVTIVIKHVCFNQNHS